MSSCGPSLPAEVAEAEEHIPEVVDYNFHIRPILSDRCYTCHGPDEKTREAGLRFDQYENATSELEESPGKYAIVPGNLRKSEVFHRITDEDPDAKMPPPESNLTLTATEIALLSRWIEQGAPYEPHWSFRPPEPGSPPDVDREAWGTNAIDRYTLAKMSAMGLTPSSEATRETLIRRVTFDLTGLPPTLEEIDQFLADESPQAYERVVDRLLQSPSYGERMAADWMDAARYADSHGYQDDGMRNMWPWRDWVIEAFNDNLPYDDFVTWQLAGDLIPGATREQILATGFNRNHMQSQEGGIVPEEYRTEYVADRVQTLGTALLGLTLQCARCHDHKYDPISQKEYYQLFGYFNSINESGVIPYAGEASPTLVMPDQEARKELEELEKTIGSYERKTAVDNPAFDNGFTRWVQELKHTGNYRNAIELPQPVGDYPLDDMDEFTFNDRAEGGTPARVSGDREHPPTLVEGRFGEAVLLHGESWVDMGEDRFFFERNEPFSLSFWVFVEKDSVSGPLAGKSNSLFNGNRGYLSYLNEDGTISASLNHVAPDHAIEVQTKEALPARTWIHLVMTYDGSSRAEGLKLYVDGREAETETLVDNLQKSILYTYNFYKGEKTNWGGGNTFRLGMIGPNQKHTSEMAFDEVKIYDVSLTPLEVQVLHSGASSLASVLSQDSLVEDSRALHQALRSYYVQRKDERYAQAFVTLKEARGQVNEIMTVQQEVMVMRERSKPRATYVLDRGVYDAPTDQVHPGTPEILPALSEDLPDNRLGLAAWLTDPDHPLTSRVAVNRFWQNIFGQGLVTTPGDFGSQGALPSHPELLDWLARDFVDSGWDVKGLMKTLVMSSTYRQTSVVPPEVRERDPGNTWLARGPSYRMTAEMIRDQALAASGLLEETVGGPSVHPYQPAGLWKELATRNETEYNQDHGEALYRRSLYTIWKRSTPPPSMISFDASERNLCLVKRQKTSTPLQALILLNDPQYVEAARILAERMIREGGLDLDAQIVFGFRLLTSRFPLEYELGMLTELFAHEKAYFESNPAEADLLLSVGEYPPDRALDRDEVAAHTMVASTIMNFDEAYMKR